MNATSLPQWCADIIANPPRAGTGFHLWLFRAARALWKCGRSENDIREVLEIAASTCGRFVPGREIDDAIRNSQVSAFQPLSAPHHPWPALNREQYEAIIATGFVLTNLWDASPVPIEDSKPHTEEIIDRLFPGNPLLCVGRSQADFDTKPRSKWRGELSRQQFIVPSPMIAWVGRTQNEGKESAHTKENTGARRFLVIEQDIGTVDEQSGILWHLAARAPLALVVHSAGKSVHGWFYANGQDEEKVLRPFMRYAVTLGACHSTWTKSQFVRMPDGTRVDGKRQAVYFFRPEVVR